MLFNLAGILRKKRRLIYVVAFISLDFWLLIFCTQTLQAHRPGLINRIHASETSLTQAQYQDGTMSESLAHMVGVTQLNILRTTVAATDGIARAEHSVQGAVKPALRAISDAAIAIVRGIGIAIGTVARAIGKAAIFIGRVIAFPFVAIGHGAGYVFATVSKPLHSHLASVIQPQNDTETPVITPEQARQVTLIQQDTLAVAPIKPAGSGGACDSGAGNGGYPLDWCDARMDTIRTVAYSSDRINRQCTSYAYWYFTTIEGHSGFRVTGNANRWARTSNYPIHSTPAVGAIAVQTGGYYGHVAIVQALPGQTHDGKVVPDGYVLVSEMNYDWQGHFRYSYSSLSKFSAYIYP